METPCPHCGAHNPSENTICLKCAQPLTPQGAPILPLAAPNASSAPAGAGLAPQSTGPVSLHKPAPVAAASAAGAAGLENASGAPPAGGAGVLYQPSGLVGRGAVPLLALAAVVGGLAAGGLYHLVAPHMNLLLVSQLCVGLIVGGAVYWAARSAKVRRPRLAIAFALLGALLAYTTFEGLNSMRTRAEAIEYLVQNAGSDIPAEEARKVAEAVVPGHLRFFPIYMRMAAESGSTLQSSSSGSGSKSGISITGGWHWALLALKVGIVALTACALAQTASAAPFCERCDAWHQTKAILKTHSDQAPLLLERARAGRWDTLGEVPVLSHAGKPPDDQNHANVSLTHCSGCADGWAELSCTVNKTTHKLAQSRLEPQMVALLAASAAKK